MARPRKQTHIIDEEAIAAPPEIEYTNDIEAKEQEESINGDSSPLDEDQVSEPSVSAKTPTVSIITPLIIKIEATRLIPLLIDAIKFLLSRKPLTPNAHEIIKKRLESATILLDAVKRMDT